MRSTLLNFGHLADYLRDRSSAVPVPPNSVDNGDLTVYTCPKNPNFMENQKNNLFLRNLHLSYNSITYADDKRS